MVSNRVKYHEPDRQGRRRTDTTETKTETTWQLSEPGGPGTGVHVEKAPQRGKSALLGEEDRDRHSRDAEHGGICPGHQPGCP